MNVETKWKDSPEQAFRRITNGLKVFKTQCSVAAKLIVEAKEREIWKIKKYSSFKEFVEEECGFSEQWAYAILDAARVSVGLKQIESESDNTSVRGLKQLESESGKNKAIIDDLTPRQAEKLKGLPLGKQSEVFHRAIEASGGKSPTPRIIQEARRELDASEAKNKNPEKVTAPMKPIELDFLGYPIPEEALIFWHRSQEIQDLLTEVSKVKAVIQKAQSADDPLFRCISQGAVDHLSRAYQFITEAKPYAVCLYCQGHHRLNGGCRNCLGVGVVSKFSYERKSPEEMRIIREKHIKTL
jgi:hypothetical protein